MRKAIAILAIVLCSIGAKGQSVSDTSGIAFKMKVPNGYLFYPAHFDSWYNRSNLFENNLLYKAPELNTTRRIVWVVIVNDSCLELPDSTYIIK